MPATLYTPHHNHHPPLRTVEGIRRVPPAEETQRRLAEEEGAGAGKEWCLEAGFDPGKLKVQWRGGDVWWTCERRVL
jgi:hypothetical protein